MNHSPRPAPLAPKAPMLGLPLLAEIRRDPLAAATRLQQECGDVAELRILFRRILYFYTPEAAREILVEHPDDFLREARLLRIFESFQGRNVLTTEGADWERQRRLLTPAFSSRRMAGYMGLMRAAIDDSIRDELPAGSGQSASVDVDALTTRITMDVILRTLFSHAATREEIRSASVAIRGLTRQSMREVYWALIPPDWLPYPGRSEKRAQIRTLRQLMARHIDTRQPRAEGDPRDADVLDMLLAACDDTPGSGAATLSTPEVYDNCLLLFAAGFDTASSALTWWIGLMATHPQMAAQVREEVELAQAAGADLAGIARLPLLNATIKEAMRLYPPSTALFTRVAQRDHTIAGIKIARGDLIAVPIWSLHRDPRSFPDPEAFRPERFLPGAPAIPRGAYMPFGAGPHFCLGQHFASVEMALVAAELICHYDLSLDAGVQLPEPCVDLALKPKTPMRVRFTPARPR
ncbi:MAG: cytochrome P450 [Xanthomonadales bacterium]|nr:cytochrome P450 [Xanthomonadales bacterium]